jgi:NadR type nicotinamide-nucleotide adenylyltransferase
MFGYAKRACPLSIKRIVIIGPESTGKSTLSAGLAAALNTVWVPEYARGYLEQLGRPYEEADLAAISNGQLKLAQQMEQQANKYLICDTDPYVVKVWSEHRYGRCQHQILADIAAWHCDLYLLTDVDMPWSYDPLREHPDPIMRAYFFQQYRDIVANSNTPWEVVRGSETQRIAAALAVIRALDTH